MGYVPKISITQKHPSLDTWNGTHLEKNDAISMVCTISMLVYSVHAEFFSRCESDGKNKDCECGYLYSCCRGQDNEQKNENEHPTMHRLNRRHTPTRSSYSHHIVKLEAIERAIGQNNRESGEFARQRKAIAKQTH